MGGASGNPHGPDASTSSSCVVDVAGAGVLVFAAVTATLLVGEVAGEVGGAAVSPSVVAESEIDDDASDVAAAAVDDSPAGTVTSDDARSDVHPAPRTPPMTQATANDLRSRMFTPRR
jgi:hypothetical protein